MEVRKMKKETITKISIFLISFVVIFFIANSFLPLYVPSRIQIIGMPMQYEFSWSNLITCFAAALGGAWGSTTGYIEYKEGRHLFQKIKNWVKKRGK